MFIGNRGTVVALPTGRAVCSREASEATYLTPLALSAGARFGLSAGICGRVLRPECSPVTSSLASSGRPLDLAQSTFCLICAEMSACDTHCVWPAAVVQVHGTTVKSWTQPRYA